jgi:L-threonylcarbamoyladenylate synthase
VSYVTDGFDYKVINLLQQGGVGLLPTDTVYGLSCSALDQNAVAQLHKIKERDSAKPFIILISNLKILNMLSISENQANVVKKYWPGALSVIFPAPSAPSWLQLGFQSLAVRLPAHTELTDLINKVGPIVSTSANLQSEPLVHSAQEAQKIFDNQLDFYVDVGQLDNPPSTLALLENGQLKVVRQGAVKIEEKE